MTCDQMIGTPLVSNDHLSLSPWVFLSIMGWKREAPACSGYFWILGFSVLQHNNGDSVHSCPLIFLRTVTVISFYFWFAASC